MRRHLGRGRVFAAVFASGLAPAATTGAASQITVSAAQLSASVNPNGSATTYAFQYGTTTNYGSQTATASAGSGTSSATVHA